MEENEKQKDPSRLKVLKKIEELETAGIFDVDVEDDPPTKMLMPNKVDYLNKKLSSKIATKIANAMGRKFIKKITKDGVLRIKEIKGIENFQNLKTGAIITCNHFNPMDSFAMQVCFDASKQKKKRMYKVIREGNYTNFPGIFGFFMRHCSTLPLSSNRDTMKKFLHAVNTILQRGDFILVYPEQSMWWNYRKPKPLKKSAFKFAASNNVPVLPIFITMEDSADLGPDGFPIQVYTINVGEPIMPDNNLSVLENTNNMKDKNYQVWKNIYEDTYKTKLTYLCDEK